MLIKFYFVVVFLIKVGVSRLMPFSDDHQSTKLSLSLCICEASNRFFQESDFTTYSVPLESVDQSLTSVIILQNLLLSQLFKPPYRAIFVNQFINPLEDDFNTNLLQKPIDNYLIEFRESEEIDELMKLNQNGFNPHARFLIFSSTIFPNPLEVVRKLIDSVWQEHLRNVVILLTSSRNNSVFQVFSWYPYEGGNCGNTFTRIDPIDSCSFGRIQNTVKWFGTKRPKTFKKCLVRVGYKILPPYTTEHTVNGSRLSYNKYQSTKGVEVNIMNTFAEILNLTMGYYIEHETGQLFNNGTEVPGLLTALRDDVYDVIIGGFGTTKNRFLQFDHTKVYTRNSLIWCAPHVIELELNNLLNIFDLKTWIGILICYSILSVLIWISSSRLTTLDRANTTRIENVLLNNFGCLISTTVTNLPNSKLARYFTIWMLFLSFVMDSTYITYLTSVIANPAVEEKYSDIRDIFNSELRTLYTDNAPTYFKDVFDRRPDLAQRQETCMNSEWCIKAVAFSKTAALCGNEDFIQYMSNKVLHKKQKRFLYCLTKRPVVSIPRNIYMKKGYFLGKSFDKIINGIIEGGLIGVWVDNILNSVKVNNSNNEFDELNNDDDLDSSSVASFQDLIPLFVLYLFGMLFALVSFLF